MIEVEIKAKVNNDGELRDKLRLMGYVLKDNIREEDLYFNAPDRDFRMTDEALRIRRTIVQDSGVERIYMTYKGNKLDRVSMARKEIETSISDFDRMKDILISLGYIPTCPVVKMREVYYKENVSVCLDKVENLGTFMEVEICVADESKHEQALNTIESEIIKLGYSMSDTTRISYLSMLESQNI